MNGRRLHHLSLAALLTLGATASAYPSSAVFAPTGRAARLGDVQLFSYGSLAWRPALAPDLNWFGLNVGLLPSLELWRDGPSFGGFEVSFDLVTPWAYGNEPAYMKPLLSAKLELLAEWGPALPSIAIGVLGVAPGKLAHGVSLIYLSLSKTITVGGTSYGRVTLGGGLSANRDRAVFNGSWPFADTPGFLLAGYESPDFGPISFAIDAMTGASEYSAANAMVFVDVVEGVSLGLGAYLSLERRPTVATTDGVMMLLSADFNAIEWAKKHFGPKEKVPPEAPPPNPDGAAASRPSRPPRTAAR